ncbi:MAG: hypothetical protein GEU28_11050 [Dehalococcoidia bacterium]|nr:hypothetical protein [Dehalococcoidia bacterium]
MMLDRLQALADRLAAVKHLVWKLVLGGAMLSAASAAFGYLVLGSGQQHQLFRDAGPISLLSVLQTLTVAVLGLMISRREPRHGDWRDYNNFWFLAGVGFLVLSFDALTDLHGVVGGLLDAHTAIEPRFGFHRVSDAIIGLYMLLGMGVTLIHIRQLLANPDALGYFTVGAGLVLGMIIFDGFREQTSWNWVVEETLKVFAGSFFVGSFVARYRWEQQDTTAPEDAPSTRHLSTA